MWYKIRNFKTAVILNKAGTWKLKQNWKEAGSWKVVGC